MIQPVTIPPIAIESAKEAAHRLLELCMSDAPPLDRDLVRSHALDVIEALTDDADAQLLEDVTAVDRPRSVFSQEEIARLRAALTTPPDLQVLHRAAGCGCVVAPVLPAPARISRERNPYVGEGADGCRRSAEIDRSEADQHPSGSEEWSRLLASAAEWELQAAWLEGKS